MMEGSYCQVLLGCVGMKYRCIYYQLNYMNLIVQNGMVDACLEKVAVWETDGHMKGRSKALIWMNDKRAGPGHTKSRLCAPRKL